VWVSAWSGEKVPLGKRSMKGQKRLGQEEELQTNNGEEKKDGSEEGQPELKKVISHLKKKVNYSGKREKNKRKRGGVPGWGPAEFS